MKKFLLLGVVALSLGGCATYVVEPAGYYYGGYYYSMPPGSYYGGRAYYGPTIYYAPRYHYGYGGWGRGWRR